MVQWFRIRLPMQESWVQSLGGEDPLEEAVATHSSILAWRIHMDRSLPVYSPWGHKELGMTDKLNTAQYRFFISFLPRNKCLLTSWLQSLSKVILEPKKIKSVTASSFPSSICYEVMGPDAIILVF